MKIDSVILLLLIYFLIPKDMVWCQHSFLQYKVEDGIAQSNVSAITMDKYGQLWIGTQGGGVTVFDGLEFSRFNTANGIPNDYINVFLSNNEGVWMGTNNGIGYYNHDRFFHITPMTGKPVKILSMLPHNDQIYVGTDNGLWVCDKDKKNLSQIWNQYFASDIIQDLIEINGKVFLATQNGLGIIHTDAVERIQEFDGLLSNNITDLTIISGDRAIITTHQGIQLFSIMPNDSINLEYIGDQSPNSILPMEANELWLGTDQGIWVSNIEDTLEYQLKSNFVDNEIRIQTIHRDDWGNIWAGSEQHGLFKHLGQRFTYFNRFSPDGNNYIRYVYQYGDQKFAVTSNLGIFRYAFGEWRQWDSLFINKSCTRMIHDQDGVIWIGTQDQGVYGVHRDSIWNHIDVRGYSTGPITAMNIDSNGTVWIGTQNRGIFTIEKFDTLSYDIIHFLSGRGWQNTTITDFHIDLQNRIWFGTNDGRLGLIDQDGLSQIFSSGQNLPSSPIRCMIEDGLGRLIVGTSGFGILISDLYTDSIHFSSPEHRPFNSLNVASLVSDNQGAIWMGTERGVEQFRVSEDFQVIDHYDYGIEQGFLSVENSVDASMLDSREDLWFGTSNGIIRYSENIEVIKEAPPILKIDQISLFNNPLSFDTIQTDTFRPSENNLSFQYRAVHLNRGKDIQYQWRLVGYENSWTPSSNTTFVNYPNLPAGKYIFEVKACIQAGNCSDTQSYAFLIEKPFWITWWFITLGAGMIIGLIVLLIRNRLISIRKKTERIEIENKLMDLEQKALQLQMNPHFLFNALNSIQGTMSEGSIPKARSQLTKFAKLMRSILSNSRKDLLPLQEEIEMLEKYIQVEQFCRGHKFDYTIEMDDSVDPDEVQIPSMVIQPFIENAIIHGLSKIDYPGSLSISFCVKGNILECKIQDNGIGIDQTKTFQPQSKTHASLGMEVTHNRLKFLSTNKEIDRVFIRDRSEDGLRGTEVKINIPLQY